MAWPSSRVRARFSVLRKHTVIPVAARQFPVHCAIKLVSTFPILKASHSRQSLHEINLSVGTRHTQHSKGGTICLSQLHLHLFLLSQQKEKGISPSYATELEPEIQSCSSRAPESRKKYRSIFTGVALPEGCPTAFSKGCQGAPYLCSRWGWTDLHSPTQAHATKEKLWSHHIMRCIKDVCMYSILKPNRGSSTCISRHN